MTKNKKPIDPSSQRKHSLAAPLKKRKSLFGFGKDLANGAIGYIRGYDDYGAPINLNYKGSETFQTFPGGLLSFIIRFILTCYGILRWVSMVQKKDWTITQQTVVADIESLKEPQRFSQFTNISMALQINPKREKQTNTELLELLESASGKRRLQEEASYDLLVNMTQRYIVMQGMYELKNETGFFPLNTQVNENSNTWATYETVIEQNKYNLKELKFNLSDVVLQGTADSIEYQDQVISRLQVKLDGQRVGVDAFKSCQSGQFDKDFEIQQFNNEDQWSFDQATQKWVFTAIPCSDYVESFASTVNKFITHIYDDPDNYPNPQEQIDYVSKIMASQNPDEIDNFMYFYYQQHSFVRLNMMGKRVEKDYTVLMQEIVPAYFQKEAKKQAKNPETYAAQRAEEKIILMTQYPTTDFECWVDDPSTFSNVFAYCNSFIDPINYKQMGYLSYMPKGDAESMSESFKEWRYLRKVTSAFGQNLLYFYKYLDSILFKKIDYELVIYDEIEKFRKHHDPKFNYPYDTRKSKLNSFTLSPLEFDFADENFVLLNYPFSTQEIKFQKSNICLESHYMQVIIDFFPDIKDFFLGFLGISSEEASSDCGGESFKKLKYATTNEVKKNLLDDYGFGALDKKIMLEVVLSLDQFQTTTVRYSTDFLMLLGDVGGFQGAMVLFFGGIGAFFSSMMFTQDIANNFFIRALNQKEIKKKKLKKGKIDDLDKLKSLFKTINISFSQLFLDPIFSLIIPFKCCKNFSCRQRKRILEKSQEKFASQLDIQDLLNFMRDTSTMLSNFKDKEQRLLLRFSKNRTIKLSESEDSDSGKETRHQLDSSEDSISDQDFNETEDQSELKKQIKMSIMNQLRIRQDLKKQLLAEDIKSTKIALQRSIQQSFSRNLNLTTNNGVHNQTSADLLQGPNFIQEIEMDDLGKVYSQNELSNEMQDLDSGQKDLWIISNK